MASNQRGSALRFGYDRFSLSVASLSALDSVLLNSNWLDTSQADAVRISRAEFWLASLNFADGETLMIGICDGDYSALEVEQAIESQPAQDADEAEVNQQMRWIKILGQLHKDTQGPMLQAPTVLKVNHTFEPEKGLSIWAYNHGGAMSAASQVVLVFAKYYYVWVRS